MKRYSPMVAIDVATKDEAISLFDQLTVEPRPILKLGMELYYHFWARNCQGGPATGL